MLLSNYLQITWKKYLTSLRFPFGDVSSTKNFLAACRPLKYEEKEEGKLD